MFILKRSFQTSKVKNVQKVDYCLYYIYFTKEQPLKVLDLQFYLIFNISDVYQRLSMSDSVMFVSSRYNLFIKTANPSKMFAIMYAVTFQIHFTGLLSVLNFQELKQCLLIQKQFDHGFDSSGIIT